MPDDKRRVISAEWARTAEESTADAYPGAWWSRTLAGIARMESNVEGLRLVVGPVDSRRYSNAQLDDYSGVTEQRAAGTRWRPPLRLRLRARMSHTPAPPQRERDQGLPGLRGTAGFGFWNAPLTLAGGPPRAPEAV